MLSALRQTLRRLAHESGFTATVLLTLALCIGANVAIYAVVDAILVRPLPFPDAGRLVDLGAPKQRALLALLVSRVGQPVAIDVIVEELWTGHPPPSAITSLQAYVANLRRVLEPDRAPRTPAARIRSIRQSLLEG